MVDAMFYLVEVNSKLSHVTEICIDTRGGVRVTAKYSRPTYYSTVQ
jgi:hypothetical protein